MQGFDFDYWRDLAQRDPEAFFRERSQLIDAYITGHSSAQARRLRAIQCQIDTLRVSAGTPDAALHCLLGLIGSNLQMLGQLSGALRMVCERAGFHYVRSDPPELLYLQDHRRSLRAAKRA